MAKTTVPAVIILSLAVGLFAQQLPDFKVVTCDDRGFPDATCKTVTPYCNKLKVEKSADPKKSLFSCLECHKGFQPSTTKEDDIRDFDLDNPDLPTNRLLLCRRTESAEPIRVPGIEWFQYEFPDCLEYTVSEVRPDLNLGRFTCTKCTSDFGYEPFVQGVVHSLSVRVQKRLCWRPKGKYQCGPRCQEKLPGCAEYNILFRDFQVLQNQTTMFKYHMYCSKAIAQFQGVMQPQEHFLDYEYAVNLATPRFQSDLVDCADSTCKQTLPKCKKYFWYSLAQDAVRYFCTECSQGYAQIQDGVLGPDFAQLVNRKRFLQLCTLQPVENLKLVDPETRAEFPGCDTLSISNVKLAEDGAHLANYVCTRCEEGYEPVPNDPAAPVYSDTLGIRNTKYRCRPVATGENSSQTCGLECRQKLPNCKEFKSVYEDLGANSTALRFKCVRCDPGFTAVKDWSAPFVFDWRFELSVCESIPTTVAIPCGLECNEYFPNCKNITTTRQPNGEMKYACNECVQGFYPMNYEEAAPGVISHKDNFLRKTPQVHLCSPDKDIIYINKMNCKTTDAIIAARDFPGCVDSDCELMAQFRNVATEQTGFVCLRCAPGFVPKTNPPGKYDTDQNFCVKRSQAALKQLRQD
jgi:hypothetical protein